MSDILDDYREWLGNQSDRVRTHYGRCHMHHDECMVARLADEITRLRDEVERLRLTDEERDALERGIEVADSLAQCSGAGTGGEPSPEATALRALLARHGGGK